VTGALDAIETLGNVPDFGNPLPPLQSSLDEFKQTASGLDDAVGGLRTALGLP
jgi:hypothetical protein